MKAEIICVGTELLLGDIVNTNAQYISKELAALGVKVYQETVVGDNPERLTQVVNTAKMRSDLLVFTGGLGPTADDLTKETVAAAFGDKLIMDEEELAKLKSFFDGRGTPMPENNIKQAMVPEKGSKIVNTCGTAPGVVFKDGESLAILMPGPPREMKTMFDLSVKQIICDIESGAIVSTMLHTIGIGESALELDVQDLLEGSNPTAALYAKEGEVAVRVTAFAEDTEKAAKMRDELVAKFYDRVGDKIYSNEEDGTLEKTVIDILRKKRQRIAVAESCTGGMMCSRITAIAGASDVFDYGAVTYAASVKRRMLGVKPSTIKQNSVVSKEVASQMAFGVKKEGKADIGVGITGYAGPGCDEAAEKPVGTVYIAVAEGNFSYVKRINVARPERSRVRLMAVQTAFDMVRRLLSGLPIEGAEKIGKHS